MAKQDKQGHIDRKGENSPEAAVVHLPDAFVERLKAILDPADFSPALQSFYQPKKTSFRANTLVTDPQEVAACLAGEQIPAAEIPWLPDAFTVPPEFRKRLLASVCVHRNFVYVQNPSSMIPPAVLDPQPAEEILDLGAAPGSKTHQMACLMHNTGKITAVEAVRSRYYKLRDNMSGLGATCVRPFFQDGTRTWRHRPEYFDRVLVDAPCSSEGRFRADDKETTRFWSARKIREMSRKQRRLLYSAVQCLKPGGTLVYSTCSFAPEENEAVVEKILSRFKGALHIVPINLAVPQFRTGLDSWRGQEFVPEMRHARRIQPDSTMDAFFVCRLEKTASTFTG